MQSLSARRRLEAAMSAEDALLMVVDHLADAVTYEPDVLQAAADVAARKDDVLAGLEVLT
jgi:hypothetical protein